MKIEYLLFNLSVLIGPLALSFDRRMHYVHLWPRVFGAILLPMSGFILWDSLVTGRHWWFNPQYTLDWRLLGLPAGEWLFFLTIPFAALFVWEVLGAYFPDRPQAIWLGIYYFPIIGVTTGIWLLFIGKEYPALVLLALSLVFIFDRSSGVYLLRRRRTYPFLLLCLGLMLIFNGYLTWRPVILYQPDFQFGIRVFTIPIEDFFYGLAYIFLCLIGFEHRKPIINP